jgi:hypothetical protein
VDTTVDSADGVQFAVDIDSDNIGIVPIKTLVKRELENTIRGLSGGVTEGLILTFEEQLTVASNCAPKAKAVEGERAELDGRFAVPSSTPIFSGLRTAAPRELV